MSQPSNKPLYAELREIEEAAEGRDLTDAEFERISRLQDQISDIEHPGYEMKEWYESVNHPNDHLMFTVFSKEDGCPVDSFKIYLEGDRYQVRGQWKGYTEAQEWANQVLGEWF